jgi:hypothetical protein
MLAVITDPEEVKKILLPDLERLHHRVSVIFLVSWSLLDHYPLVGL